jgi:GNAT superfamily N-acetyltransferase
MWKLQVEDSATFDVEEAAAVYRASTLAERRPVEDTVRFTAMIRGCNLLVTARLDEKLIGISRSLTDGAYVTYLCDLAVDKEFQRKGIGRDLVRATQEVAPAAKIVLLSAPAAVDYYPHIGFQQHDSAWVLDALA